MSDFDATGYSQRFSSVRRGRTSGVRAQEPDGQRYTERVAQKTRQQRMPQARASERTTHARLNYDREDKEVVLEILDLHTGDVLRKVTGEELSEDTIRRFIDAARTNTKTSP